MVLTWKRHAQHLQKKKYTWKIQNQRKKNYETEGKKMLISYWLEDLFSLIWEKKRKSTCVDSKMLAWEHPLLDMSGLQENNISKSSLMNSANTLGRITNQWSVGN